jgi:NADH:quinone reductase (non-electrogenic)
VDGEAVAHQTDSERQCAPRLVIVGGGMGGIQAAKALAKASVQVTLVDVRNYYVFQPLIYEVANALS